MEDMGIPFFIVALGFIAFIGFGCIMDSAACEAQTKDIGMNHRWGIMSGCMVQDNKTNAWIPLDNYRNID